MSERPDRPGGAPARGASGLGGNATVPQLLDDPPRAAGRSPDRGSFALHLFSACTVIALWGASFAVTRMAVREIPPLTLAFLRFALAAALLWPAVRSRCRGRRIEPSDRLTAFGLGFLGVTLYFAFENWGLVFTTASHGSLIVTTIPLAIALADAWRRRTRPPTPLLAGLVIALAGVSLTVGPSAGKATLVGDALMFGAVFAWVGYTFLARHLSDRYPTLLVTQAAMVVGAATLAPLAAAELLYHPIVRFPSPLAWAGVTFLGVFCSAMGYLLWNAAIPALGVTLSSNLINGIPLVGVLTGVAALGEPFTAAMAVGGVLIVGGVALASRGQGAAAPRERQKTELAEEFR